MKKKCLGVIKIFAFLIILVSLMFKLGDFLSADDPDTIANFYEKEKNSLDVVCLGSSGIRSSFSPNLAWNLYGFTSYDYGTITMPISTFKCAIEEIRKTQNPKLFVIELETIKYDDEEQRSISNVHRFFDVIPLSLNKIKTEVDILRGNCGQAFFHSLAQHHYQYKLINEEIDKRFFNKEDDTNDGEDDVATEPKEEIKDSMMNGCSISSDTFKPKKGKYDLPKNDDSKEEIGETSEYYLRELLDYCKNNDLNVLFILSPRGYSHDHNDGMEIYRNANYAGEIIEEYGYDFINYSDDIKQYGMNIKKDYYNYGHMNVLGQTKFTEVLGKEIVSRIEIDEKPSEVQKQWDEYYEYYDENARVALEEIASKKK